MEAQWTLVVEGLGRIERAEVRIHPFMLFVGENNSGKSYLASLLWGLVSLGGELFPREKVPSSDAYSRCFQWLQDKFEHHTESTPYRLQESDYALFVDLLNDVLAERKDHLVSLIFNVTGMKIARLELKELRRHKPLHLGFRLAKPGMPAVESDEDFLSFAILKEYTESQDLNYFIIQRLTRRIFLGELDAANPIYLPASRTGFVLLHKSVVSQLIGGLHESKRGEELPHLTSPTINFLRLLALLRPGNGSFSDEAALLEQGSLQGRVALKTEVGVNELNYHPSGATSPLSMALSSSLVTELAPIILVLRHAMTLGLLVLEEPEAHLHPKIQRLLAQTLVRLVRKGLPVWVTTHSENFCQQINNFIKLSQHPNRAEVAKQLGYGEQDYLEPSEAVGFQFVTQGATSTVTKLEKSASGFTMPTFNEELMALSRETLFLQREAAKPNEHD
jgi:hypothetical protein